MSAFTEDDTADGPQADGRDPTLRRAAMASFIGNFIEWFDYASYGYLAAVIGAVFFPDTDATVRLMSSFAVFAMSFVLRPVGAIAWGTWGDRFGRRWALSWSILIMSGSTFLIGLLPGYATIGVCAPVALLVLRMIQGFSASGEYAGAGTFLAEFAPADRRGLYTSLVPASTATGMLVGSLAVTGLHACLDDAAVESWGWRIPFLVAGPLGLVGRYIRVHLEDSPAFRAMRDVSTTTSRKKTPFRDLVTRHGRVVGIAFGVACLNAVAFYLLLTYMPTYLQEELGVSATKSTAISAVTLVVYICSIFLMGRFSDAVGRRRMLIGACVAFIVLSVPLFWVMERGSIGLVVVSQIVFALILTANDGTLATFLAESFPTEVRYSGFALSFNAANALFGGTAPFIATWLIDVTGSGLSPAVYLSIVAAGAFGAMAAAKDLTRVPMAEAHPASGAGDPGSR